jgi:TetR/AcrR family transcriptional regulator, regulator of autoinduction and epiphytic fitness
VEVRTANGAREAQGHVDGRTARSDRTRDAIVAAMLDLYEEGDVKPNAERIAARAGVSARTIFQHFHDREELFAAVADRQWERVSALADVVSPDLPLPERIDAFLRVRVRQLQAITPVRRAAILVEPFSGTVAARLRASREHGRRQVEDVFAHELNSCAGPEDRTQLLAALSAATAWSTWEGLREHQGLSKVEAREVMRRTIAALLA